MNLVDTHCHLQFQAFQHDAADAIERAQKEHCTAFIVVGAKVDSSRAAVTFAKYHHTVYAAVGIHPHHADSVGPADMRELHTLAFQKKVVAIGEIGLDYHNYNSNGTVDPNLQKKVFRDQFMLAKKLNLPVILHCRDAWDELLPLVAQYHKSDTRNRGVFHCWSGSWVMAEKAIAMGYSLSFAGNLTYPKSHIQTVAKRVPLPHILLETDAPYLAPQEKRGQRNEPAFLHYTAAFLAKLRGEPVEKIARVTTENAQRLFTIQ